ncbi:intermembrane transport protein PqiB [Salinicola rhizosphaerae]|uniref:Paraquat-inducible protein B n=1 Tax=Salinicola rhizosphaerae TaxID=1443141 RepID=A0ABQ3DS55_9GAMM|nr:intermembrane transport protein PqiB [Salinicola rhizosphaerae]GHB10152.1 paraquat-inducible protein B [Salinicola rhizosphaerae]
MPESMQRAKRLSQSRLSPIWIVPLLAALIGAWMVWDNITSRGPLITLNMQNAEGIEAGKTLIKTRNVEVGHVEAVRLSDDLSHTVVTARMSRDAERMLNSDSRFWVVKPRIGREGISGLNTVLSGAYIQLTPGKSDESQDNFDVLDQPPVAPPDAPGLRINLVSQVGNSLSAGDPVTYQGYTVGRVESTEFDPDKREMRHRLFIQAPYDSLVTDTTRFWSSSGIDIQLDSEGVNVNLDSFETLISGGVTFGVPEDVTQGSAAKQGATYTLYNSEESAREGTYDQYIEYVLLVDDTVRGLSRGAPVEYRGVRIGTVESVPWHFTAPQPDSLTQFAIPVLIRIEPQRLESGDDVTGDIDDQAVKDRFEKMFKNYGLRATLKAGNLLTGALFVDVNFNDDADPYKPLTFDGKPVFPTMSGGFAQIEQKVSNLLDKLNNLQVEPILERLDQTMQTSQQTLEQVRQIAQSVNAIVSDPATQQLPSSLNDTLQELQGTLNGFSSGSRGYQQLNDTLKQLETLMRDLQPVARTLREQPNALIFDREVKTDPVPRAPQ